MRLTFLFLFALLNACGAQEPAQRPGAAAAGPVGGGCDGCEWMFVGGPERMAAADTSAGWREGGARLLLRGRVFTADGRTPASGVVIYYWQTDSRGLYDRGSDTSRGAAQHGRIRGWVKTGGDGLYAIYTIRPAPYPNAAIPAHIHFSIKEPGQPDAYYIDDVLFEDDPLLTAGERNRQPGRGGPGIVRTEKEGGVLTASRDIYLGRHIPNYR